MATITQALARPFQFIPPQRRQAVFLLVLAAILLVLPWIRGDDADDCVGFVCSLRSLGPSDSGIDSFANAMSYAALALGLNVVVGFAGLLDLGYAAFFAIGAYYYGILTSFQVMPLWSDGWAPLAFLGLVEKLNQGGPDLVHFTLSFWLALPTAALVAAFFGILFGAPTLRLRGDYLAIVTLGFGEIVPIVARNLDGITNGAAGLNGVQAPRLFGYNFGIDSIPYYYVGLVLIGVLVFVSSRLRDSRVGRAWMAIREDETAAGAMGVNQTRFKLLAFAIGAAFAGMTGVYFVAKLQTATPEMFNFNVSSMLLVMVVLGGMGSVWGVVVGAVLLQLMQTLFLPQLSGWLQAIGEAVGSPYLATIDLVQWTQLFFGIILIAMMLYRRDGLIPATKKVAPLSFEAQNVSGVSRGGFLNLDRIPPWTPGTGNALDIQGVTVRFGGLVALNKIDLVVPEGGVVAVIGPNGSGKSTLFNVITGLVPATGAIVFRGEHDLLGRPSHEILKLGVARTFQNIRLFPTLSVLTNVMVGRHARLTSGAVGSVLHTPHNRHEEAEAHTAVLDIIAMFGNRLTPRLEQAVGGLSYANRRRVEIARALASRPHLLLLDEPTAGMNPAETLELAEQIKSLHAMGLTILIIEHKLDVVTTLADKVIVLDHGEKIAEGTPDEVRRNDQVLTAYLGRAARAALETEHA